MERNDGQDGPARGDDLPDLEPPPASEVSDVEVTIEWHGVEPTNTVQATSEGDGWHDLPAGAEPFTPAQMMPDRTFLISEFMPDSYDTPGHGYAEPGSEDPDSPKARLRRELVERNPHIYGRLLARCAEDGVGADEDSREDDSGSDQT